MRTPFRCTACKDAADFTSQADLDAHVNKRHLRSFNCVFDFAGCNSTFGSKNEWKRHVRTQHLLLHYWICTECISTGQQPPPPPPGKSQREKPNGSIFNRKDLFTAHLKRMHAPPDVKDQLPSPKSLGGPTIAPAVSSSHGKKDKQTTHPPHNKALLSQWAARIKKLQEAAIRPRCHLPTFMRCPVPGCPAPPFRGQEAWNQRMEHVAKHMEGAAQGKEGRVVFGGEGDDTLVEWAAREEVGIIVPSSSWKGKDGEGNKWVLKAPLKRGPGGNVVVTAPVRGRVVGMASRGGDEEEVQGEIVVVSPLDEGQDEDELDADGEEDD